MKLRSTIPALAVAGLLVLALDPAGVSAAAKNLVLGKSNKVSSTTTLQNTGSGPALSLKAKSGKPALAVSSTAKIPKLNADKVDGMDASALGVSTTEWRLVVDQATTNAQYQLPLEPGRYLVSYSAHLIGAQNAAVDCRINSFDGDSLQIVARSGVAGSTAAPGLSGSGAVEANDAGAVVLECDSTVAFTTANDEPIQIVATKIASYTDGGEVTTNIRPTGRR